MRCLSTRCAERVRLGACALVLAALCGASVGCAQHGRNTGESAVPECGNATLPTPWAVVELPKASAEPLPHAPRPVVSSVPQPGNIEQSVLQVD